MKRVIPALLTLWFTASTHAAVVDLSRVTCWEFQANSKDEIRLILAWLDGYYKDEQDPPVIDTDALVENLRRLDEYCTANPTAGLLTATDRLFKK
jgi:acid stress chaperone HdeB